MTRPRQVTRNKRTQHAICRASSEFRVYISQRNTRQAGWESPISRSQRAAQYAGRPTGNWPWNNEARPGARRGVGEKGLDRITKTCCPNKWVNMQQLDSTGFAAPPPVWRSSAFGGGGAILKIGVQLKKKWNYPVRGRAVPRVAYSLAIGNTRQKTTKKQQIDELI